MEERANYHENAASRCGGKGGVILADSLAFLGAGE